jgi:hypothetical protein
MKIYKSKAIKADGIEGIEYQINNFLENSGAEVISVSHSSMQVMEEDHEIGFVEYTAILLYTLDDE